jgi:CysZ protein
MTQAGSARRAPHNNPLTGAGYLFKGLRLVLLPGMRRYVVVPALINIVLFGAVLYFGSGWIHDLARELLPEWLAWLAVVLVPLFLVLSAVAVFFTFTLVANLLASPFNGMLAEAVESRLTGRPAPPASMGRLMKDVGIAIASELRKLGYILVRIVPLLLLFLVPLAGPLLWALFSAWMLAIAFMDYPMGNHGLGFAEQRRILAGQRWLGLGFGLAVMAAMAVPVVNFFVMPCAVAGATALWVDALAPQRAAGERLPDAGA